MNLFATIAVRRVFVCAMSALGLPALRAAELPELWAERVKSVVAIEYVTETEVERRPSVTMGTVIDAAGTVVVQANAIDPRVATWQLKDFKVYLPGEGDSTPGQYLGQDAYTGWHFVRADEAIRAKLVPITAFAVQGNAAAATVKLADFAWGIGLRGKDEDFTPYLLQSTVALISRLPHRTGIAQREVAAPGLPVFNRDGVFLGLGLSSFGQTFLQFTRGGRSNAVILYNVEESSAFMLAEEVLPNLGRIPKNVTGRPLAWLGAYGLEPMDRDVARFLNLTGQAAAVVSEVVEGSPAAKAGLRARDIVLGLDGKALPQLKPDSVIVRFLDGEIHRRAPGDELILTVLRGADRRDLKVALGEEPKLVREAERKFYERIGVVVREFVHDDAVERRVKAADAAGVVAHHVKPSSPVAVAGLRFDDWIKEIDGTETKTFADAVAKLAEIERDNARPEFVLLVSRGNETAVLRVKLK
jgi:serine protease Do